MIDTLSLFYQQYIFGEEDDKKSKFKKLSKEMLIIQENDSFFSMKVLS